MAVKDYSYLTEDNYIRNLTLKEAKKAYNSLSKVVNNRLDKLERNLEKDSFAYQQLLGYTVSGKKETPNFVVYKKEKGDKTKSLKMTIDTKAKQRMSKMSEQELLRTYQKNIGIMSKFLNAKTSTVQGIKDIKKQTLEALKNRFKDKNIKSSVADTMWKKAKEAYKRGAKNYYISTETQEAVIVMIEEQKKKPSKRSGLFEGMSNADIDDMINRVFEGEIYAPGWLYDYNKASGKLPKKKKNILHF